MNSKFRLASLAFVSLFVLSFSLGAIHPVKALTPVSTLYITPNATGPLVFPGTLTVNITGDRLGSSATSGINGWDLVFSTGDPTFINLQPTAISTANNLLTPFGTITTLVNCVNGGAGIGTGLPGNIGCDISDGPGVFHTAIGLSAPATPAPISGLLATVSFNVNGASADTLGILSPCSRTQGCDTLSDGSATPVPHVTLGSTVQTAVADYEVTGANPAPFNPGGSGTGTFTVTSLNLFTNTLKLSTDVSGFAGTSSLSAAALTISCGALTPNPLPAGGTSSSTCTFSGTTPGVYVVTANVTDTAVPPTVFHLASITVLVGDFSVTGPAGAVNVPVTNSGSGSATVASVNGFAGGVVIKKTVASPDFSINAASIVAAVSGTAATNVVLTNVNGLTGATVSLSDTVPAGPTCSALPATSPVPAAIAFSCTSAAAGTFGVTISATATISGFSVTKTATFAVTFGTLRDFNVVAVSPPAANIGDSASSTINVIAANSGTGTVTLSNTVPAGLTCQPISSVSSTVPGTASLSCSSPTAGSFAVTVSATNTTFTRTSTSTFNFVNVLVASCPASVTVPASGSVPAACTFSSTTPGSYLVTVTGTFSFTGGSITHFATMTINIGDFTVTVSTTTQTMQAGYGGTASVTLSPKFAWNRPVTLAFVSTPAGVTAATGSPCATAQVPSGVARTCTFSSVLANTYTITVTASCSGCSPAVTRTAQFTMVVNPDFNIAAGAVSPATILVGAQGTSTITITNHNFTGPISFTVNLGTPAGLNCGSTPVPVIFTSTLQNSATTTLSCTSATATTYAGVVVTSSATGAGIVPHSTAALSFKFIGFSISANPASIVNAHAGTSNSTTITLTALNGFTGTITLTNNSTSFSPAWTATCTLATIISKGAMNSTSCAITAPAGVSGTFHVGFTGTSGTFSTSTTVSVTVAAAAQHSTSTTISCHPTTIVVSNSTSCTVTVTDTAASPTTPSGTVTFLTSGTGTFTTCTLAGTGAVATCSTTYTPTVIGTGSHTLTATYAATATQATSSGNAVITVTQRTTTTSVSCASPVAINQGSLCTVTVTDTSPGTFITPTGTVTVTSSVVTSTFTGTCSLSGTTAVATCQTTYTQTASTTTPTINATFPADANHTTSQGTTTITVTLRTTTTTISCHPTTIVVNNSTSCTVTVADTSSGTAITPSGTIGLTSSGTGTFTTCALGGTGAVATCSTTYTPTVIGTGSHTLTATFATTTTHSTSSGNAVITVIVRATTTTVVCAPSPVTVNSPTTCTVTVKDNSPGTLITPGGTVTLASNGAGTFTGTCTLFGSAGTATCQETYTPSGTAPRTDTITGTYPGDSTHSGSQGTFQLPVNPVAGHQTTTTISCHPTTIVLNNSTNCTVTVTDVSTGPTTPTGTVSISTSGTGTFNQACILSGTGASATCSFTYAPTVVGTGTHTLTANYPGDSQTPAHGSSSNTTNMIVTVRATTTTITCHPTTIVVNNSTSCTVIVTDTSPGIASSLTGTVGLASSGTGTFTACNLSAGSCTVTYTPTVIGTGSHLLIASYGGDSTHGTSQGTATIAVIQRSTTTSITCSQPSVAVGSSTTCTATVQDTSPGTAITPGGTVAFTSNSTVGSFTFTGSPCNLTGAGATATCQVTYGTSGTTARHDLITDTYSGDTNHTTSQGTFKLAVSAQAVHTTATTISCDPITIVVNNGTNCTATVTDIATTSPTTPTGTVAFTSNGTGTFTGTCALTGTTSSASCMMTVTYTPTAIGTGTHAITGTYNGDATHSSSQGATSLTINKRATSTTVNCAPANVVINQPSTCTAIVADTSSAGTLITPGGTVTFASTGGAGLFSSTTCTLIGGQCSVAFTPSTTTVSNISAIYGGDANHSGSSTATAATVTGSPLSQKDFMLSVSPTSLTLVEDSLGRAFVTLQSNGFDGTVDLSLKISPAGQGLTAHLVRIHVLLAPDSKQRILLVVSGDEANAGDYTITVTGTSGSLSHSANLKVTVTHPGDDQGGFLGQFFGWFLLQVSTSRWD